MRTGKGGVVGGCGSGSGSGLLSPAETEEVLKLPAASG